MTFIKEYLIRNVHLAQNNIVYTKSMQMKRFYYCLTILLCMTSIETNAQIAIYQSNPLGLASKERVKLEYRINNNNSVLFAGTAYWGLCPGAQGYAEYRNYHFTTRRTEMFFYGKAGIGNGNEHGIDAGSTGPFTYILAGGGMGYHFNIGESKVFFMDLSLGLKGCQRIITDPNGGSIQLFYISGPGSIVDINFHFGFQIGRKPMY